MKTLRTLFLIALSASQALAQSPALRVWSAEPSPLTIEAPEGPDAVEATSEPSAAAAAATNADLAALLEDPRVAAALAAVPPEKLVGASIVIDPAHIAQTVNNITQAYERYRQLVEMVKKAQRDLERLGQIPFVDDTNATGAFLANMNWLIAGGNYDEDNPALIEDTLGYSHPEIVELLGEYFPGPRIVPGTSEEPLLRPDPWETYESPAELYFARDNALLTTAYRVAEAIENHAAQVSRERQGIEYQRRSIDGADGNAQHLEMLFAALHQSLDAQSVERQVSLLGTNLQYLAFADEVNARLEQQARIWHHVTALREALESEPTATGGNSIGLAPFRH
jgi:hypothetical protein